MNFYEAMFVDVYLYLFAFLCQQHEIITSIIEIQTLQKHIITYNIDQ